MSFNNFAIALSLLNFMSVKQLINVRTLIFIRKIIIDGDLPKYLTEKIRCNRDVHSRMLRNANENELLRANLGCSQNALFYKGIQLYGSLPNEETGQRILKNYI